MIAADTSTWVAFLQGDRGEDAQLLDRALEDRQVLMPPVVLTEMLSDPKLPSNVAQTLRIASGRDPIRLLATGRRVAIASVGKAA
jgi:uncharacterized protein with PIN domain